MTIKWLALSAVAMAASLIVSSPSTIRAATPQLSVQIGGGWDQPPAEFHDVQRQGFHDGIDAARRDFANHRHADADDHEQYRHPHVDRGLRHDYREGFRRGYDVAMHHLWDHPDSH
jgi:hypothetical protein